MRLLDKHKDGIQILAYPYPYKAWLSVSNDPDNTSIKDWEELDRVIWKELELPLGDTLFIKSFNENLKGQVNLHDNPEIGGAHALDSIHTWGDYMHSRAKNFDRSDAIEGMKILEANDLHPSIWIDHSAFEGNLLHQSNLGAIPKTTDQAGHSYENFKYTLDLIKDLGIRFIWDGELTQYVGQDLKLSPSSYYSFYSASKRKSRLKALFSKLPMGLQKMFGFKFLNDYNKFDNSQYRNHIFQDNSELYVFKRFGTWEDADIDGLGNVISSKTIETLINRKGTSIVYTHLGKRKEKCMQDSKHIPSATYEALKYIKSRYDQGDLNISPTSELLRYLVLRDHIRIDTESNTIEIKADGILNKEISAGSLAGFSFSIKFDSSVDPHSLKFRSEGRDIAFSIEDHGENFLTFSIT